MSKSRIEKFLVRERAYRRKQRRIGILQLVLDERQDRLRHLVRMYRRYDGVHICNRIYKERLQHYETAANKEWNKMVNTDKRLMSMGLESQYIGE